MMNLWKKLGVDNLLRNSYDSGAIMCGVSAGSICWFNFGISDSRQFKNPDSNEYIKVSGLGFINAIHCPHYGSKFHDKGYRSKGMRRIMKRSNGVCIAIPDGCAIEFVDDEYRVIGNRENFTAYKCYWSNGEYVKEELKKNNRFYKISDLLKKTNPYE